MNYSNPQKNLLIKDWPYGRVKTDCMFEVEEVKGKQRAVKTTRNPKTGSWNKPSKMTYAIKVLFVTGDDGRTYVMQFVGWAFSVMEGNFKYQKEVIADDDPRFKSIMDMFKTE